MISERTQCAELLALTPPDDLIALSEVMLDDGGDPVVLRGPELGSVMLTVREPVEATRFHLGDVLVTQVEVEHRSTRGWAMRLGDEPLATLAAALCDAELAANGPHADTIRSLCSRTASAVAADRDREWAELAPTIVAFEEMD